MQSSPVSESGDDVSVESAFMVTRELDELSIRQLATNHWLAGLRPRHDMTASIAGRRSYPVP
jgi:hypothetical protein